MVSLKRISNIVKYGIGEEAYKRKRADKLKAREAKFHTSGLWGDNEDLTTRRYESYEEYVKHQASKLDRVIHRLEENEDMLYDEFVDRLRSCEPLKEARTVLCLAARVGTEVRALHSLGYFAVGIDLNPGPDNPYVLPGDFHALVFPEGSVDALYTNSLDHVFDLERMLGEVVRVLRPGGLFVTDVLAGYEEGFIPGEYEATHWRTVESFTEKMLTITGLRLVESRPLGKLFRGEYTQVVMRKPL